MPCDLAMSTVLAWLTRLRLKTQGHTANASTEGPGTVDETAVEVARAEEALQSGLQTDSAGPTLPASVEHQFPAHASPQTRTQLAALLSASSLPSTNTAANGAAQRPDSEAQQQSQSDAQHSSRQSALQLAPDASQHTDVNQQTEAQLASGASESSLVSRAGQRHDRQDKPQVLAHVSPQPQPQLVGNSSASSLANGAAERHDSLGERDLEAGLSDEEPRPSNNALTGFSASGRYLAPLKHPTHDTVP